MDDTTAILFATRKGSHLELIEYLARKGASITAMTKAGQTPTDSVSTEEVRALLVECKQPLTKWLDFVIRYNRIRYMI
ncbi:Ankyrin repeat [Musa troglodytarum]|uniref:Ankyrin repeat n=1 Tax=Musa troglodytarum TaxID=320322 RepID=A0A9E7JJJ6_9LILI|nr:Ankyrin repeat [Musa troglodytarum]